MSIVDYRFRIGAVETLVLQVNVADDEGWPDRHRTVKWRDAKVEDLLEVAKLLGAPELRSVA